MTLKPIADLPFQYLITATNFYNSAYSEYHRRGIDSLTIHSLIFHSFEVLLKGFLLRKGITPSYTHDLCSLLDSANTNDLSTYITNETLKCSCNKSSSSAPPDTLCHLSAHKENKQLYYPVEEGLKNHPNVDNMLNLCKELLLDLLDYVGGDYKNWAEEQYQNINSSFIKETFNAEYGIYQIEPFCRAKKDKLLKKYSEENLET